MPHQPPAAQVELMSRALQAAVVKDYHTAREAVVQFDRDHPGDMHVALLGWIDTAIHNCGVHNLGGSPKGIAWAAEETGQVTTDADQMDPATRWAGRVFSARVNDDHDTFHALITSAWASSPTDWSQGCWAVLLCAAATIRGARDGKTAGLRKASL